MNSTGSQANTVTVETSRDRLGAVKGFWQTAMPREKVMMIVGAVYIASPVDIIPEALFGPLGLVDDATASLVLILGVAHGVAKRYRDQRRI